MHDAGGDQCRPDQDDEAAEQSPALGIDDVQERAHAGRVAGELEKPHHPEYQDDAQIGRQCPSEPERQHRQQVDDPGGAQDVLQAGALRPQMVAGRIVDRDPHPQPVLEGEDGQRQDLDGAEDETVAMREVGHRLQRHRRKVDDDQCHDEATDDAGAVIADGAVMEYFIEPAPQRLRGWPNACLHAVSAGSIRPILPAYHLPPTVHGFSPRHPEVGVPADHGINT